MKITVTPVLVADLLVDVDTWLPVYVHVVDHPEGRVLVDTGLTQTHPLAEDMDPQLHDWHVDDVDLVVNTHLHFDHLGGNHRYAGTPTYVQRRELEDARSQALLTVPEWVDPPGVEYVAVDGEHELLPGLRLVPAPGHTDGSQLVVIDGEAGPVVICGDAAVLHAQLDEPGDEGQRIIRALEPTAVWMSHAHEPWRPPVGR